MYFLKTNGFSDYVQTTQLKILQIEMILFQSFFALGLNQSANFVEAWSFRFSNRSNFHPFEKRTRNWYDWRMHHFCSNYYWFQIGIFFYAKMFIDIWFSNATKNLIVWNPLRFSAGLETTYTRPVQTRAIVPQVAQRNSKVAPDEI